jgi:hypothetical protein
VLCQCISALGEVAVSFACVRSSRRHVTEVEEPYGSLRLVLKVVRNDRDFVVVILLHLQKVTCIEDIFFLYGLDLTQLGCSNG